MTILDFNKSRIYLVEQRVFSLELSDFCKSVLSNRLKTVSSLLRVNLAITKSSPDHTIILPLPLWPKWGGRRGQLGSDHIFSIYQMRSFQPCTACLNIYQPADINILKCTKWSKDVSHEALTKAWCYLCNQPHLERSNDKRLFGIFIGGISLGVMVSNELLGGSHRHFKSLLSEDE